MSDAALKKWSGAGKGAYLAVDELDVLGTLRVAVTRTVGGTSLVSGKLALAAVSIHLCEAKSVAA